MKLVTCPLKVLFVVFVLITEAGDPSLSEALILVMHCEFIICSGTQPCGCGALVITGVSMGCPRMLQARLRRMPGYEPGMSCIL